MTAPTTGRHIEGSRGELVLTSGERLLVDVIEVHDVFAHVVEVETGARIMVPYNSIGYYRFDGGDVGATALGKLEGLV